MQTHSDLDAQTLQNMEKLAKEMTRAGINKITAGESGEGGVWEGRVGTINVKQLPDDPNALRISIGEAHSLAGSAYLVYRGNHRDCRELLERALAAMVVSEE